MTYNDGSDMEKLLSVIVPVYNAESEITGCIEALEASACPSMEIIVIDDGSTDNSLNVCNNLSLKYNNMKVYHQQNRGVSEARNRGIQNSSGSWICFVDSDDLIILETFDKALGQLSESPSSCDMLVCGYQETGMDRNILSVKDNENLPGMLKPEEACIALIEGRLNVCVGSFFIRRERLGRNTYLSGVRYGEDTTYIAECLVDAENILITPDPVLSYRQNTNSAMHKLDLSRFDNYTARVEVKNYIKKYHPEMRKLYSRVADYYVPYVLYDDIRLLCHYGYPFPRLRRFMNSQGIEEALKAMIHSDHIDSVLQKYLYLWDRHPLTFYMKERNRRIKYIIRSSLSIFVKKHLLKRPI